MKRSRPLPVVRRKSTTPHYQTFPTPPPKSKGRPPSNSPPSSNDGTGMSHDDSYAANHPESPLPTKQLAVLAVMALCEQTALNSIGPYLPTMVSTFPDVDDPDRVGLYVGIIVSTFALAQFITSFFWAWLSDRIGRKPVIIVGTVLTAVGFLAFGFCRALWQAILIQAFIGLVNGNQGIVSACLGEITNRSNQSKVFTYLPMIYGIGGITGPVLGGLLGSSQDSGPYPFLVPNLVCAAILTIDFIIITIFLDESLEEARDLPHLGQRAGSLFAWIFQFISAKRPTYLKRQKLAQVNGDAARGAASDSDTDSDIVSDSSHSSSSNHMPSLIPENTTGFTSKDILNRDSIIFLSTYLIFQLSNVSFGALYTIFGQANPPTGRGLSPKEIGLSLGYAGGVAILSQMGIFGPLREKMGNVATYRTGLAGFVLVFFLMPFVGYKDNGDGGGQATSTGKAWLWIELGFALLVKTVAATGGLTSALLLITNSASNHSVLGTLNGIAQTLSAASRVAGPFLSGGLFSISTHVRPKGDALAFGVFGGISFLGFVASLGIRNPGLEAEGWDEEVGNDAEDESEEHGLLQ